MQKPSFLNPTLFTTEYFEYLKKNDLRALRLAHEFNKVDMVLREHNIMSTIVVFGSSRVFSPEQLNTLSTSSHTPFPRGEDLWQTTHLRWYQLARDVCRIISERGGALAPAGAPLHNIIATGGGPGIMEAANRGASEAGALSIGFNIILPNEQPANNYTSPELTFWFHYFALRKMHFAMRANALIVFPGGFGTLDELFEIITLKQVRRISQLPVILFDRQYWTKVINFEALHQARLIDTEDALIFEYADTVEETWRILIRYGLDVHPPLSES